METRKSENWVRCPYCRHKLFKMVGANGGGVLIEAKCHSCKAVFELWLSQDSIIDKAIVE